MTISNCHVDWRRTRHGIVLSVRGGFPIRGLHVPRRVEGSRLDCHCQGRGPDSLPARGMVYGFCVLLFLLSTSDNNRNSIRRLNGFIRKYTPLTRLPTARREEEATRSRLRSDREGGVVTLVLVDEYFLGMVIMGSIG